MKLEKKKRIPK